MNNIFGIYKKFYETCFAFDLIGGPEGGGNSMQEENKT
jgi:hypothetical protein